MRKEFLRIGLALIDTSNPMNRKNDFLIYTLWQSNY